jgi:hypothetical protein
MIRQYAARFWGWYERHQKLNTILVSLLFTWQLWHLYWLTTAVVFPRLFGVSLFNPSRLVEILILSADFAEIPALIGATLLYLAEIRRRGYSAKNLGLIFLINTQWLHIFWITDEFIVEHMAGHSLVSLPLWLAWIAILIDYLELPVIYDTLKKSVAILRQV